MNSWILDRLLWAVSVGAVAVTVGQIVVGPKSTPVSQGSLPEMRAVLTYNPRELLAAADSVTSTDPFRLDRHPSQPTLSPPTIASPSTNASERLRMALTGISGGPPWHAIISGISGHEDGAVMKAGDTLGGIKVRTIRRDTVILQTADSTLTLTLKR
jgi:hypothetical protein